MTTERKIKQVEMLQDKLDRCSIAVATNPTGVDVNGMNEIRSKLRELNIEYKVVKNTLFKIAADQAEMPAIKDLIDGTTAIAFGYGDEQIPAKVITRYVRDSGVELKIRNALIGDRTLSSDQLKELAALPGKEELAGKLVGQLYGQLAGLVHVMNNPLVRLARSLNSPSSGLVNVLNSRVQQIS